MYSEYDQDSPPRRGDASLGRFLRISYNALYFCYRELTIFAMERCVLTEMAPLGLTPRFVHKILIAEHLDTSFSCGFSQWTVVDCSGPERGLLFFSSGP